MFRIEYHSLVVENDIPKLDKFVRDRIRDAIETKLVDKPMVFGAPLRGTLKGYWKLRIGDWRVVYLISAKVVRIIFIAHRRDIYDLLARRKK